MKTYFKILFTLTILISANVYSQKIINPKVFEYNNEHFVYGYFSKGEYGFRIIKFDKNYNKVKQIEINVGTIDNTYFDRTQASVISNGKELTWYLHAIGGNRKIIRTDTSLSTFNFYDYVGEEKKALMSNIDYMNKTDHVCGPGPEMYVSGELMIEVEVEYIAIPHSNPKKAAKGKTQKKAITVIRGGERVAKEKWNFYKINWKTELKNLSRLQTSDMSYHKGEEATIYLNYRAIEESKEYSYITKVDFNTGKIIFHTKIESQNASENYLVSKVKVLKNGETIICGNIDLADEKKTNLGTNNFFISRVSNTGEIYSTTSIPFEKKTCPEGFKEKHFENLSIKVQDILISENGDIQLLIENLRSFSYTLENNQTYISTVIDYCQPYGFSNYYFTSSLEEISVSFEYKIDFLSNPNKYLKDRFTWYPSSYAIMDEAILMNETIFIMPSMGTSVKAKLDLPHITLNKKQQWDKTDFRYNHEIIETNYIDDKSILLYRVANSFAPKSSKIAEHQNSKYVYEYFCLITIGGKTIKHFKLNLEGVYSSYDQYFIDDTGIIKFSHSNIDFTRVFDFEY